MKITYLSILLAISVTGFAQNVGINNPNPHAPLHFNNDLVNRKIVLFEQANNDHEFAGIGLNGGFVRYQLPNTTDSHIFYAGLDSENSQQLFRIKGNGNVGIGNVNPTGQLQFENGIANRKLVLFDSDGGENGFYGFGINDLTLRYQTDNPLADHVFFSAIDFDNSLELMRIKGAGNVEIGANLSSSKQTKLYVNAEGFSNGLAVDGSNITGETLKIIGRTLLDGSTKIGNSLTVENNLAVGGNSTLQNLNVIGSLSKSSGTFKIDHPQDPLNKYLYHSFVESPDMMNVYNGNTKTDENGNASVELPTYFEALNKDFRYQLTVIGTFAQAIVSEKVKGNKFVIKTDKPNVEVSWQVTGIRNDAYARKNRIVDEVEKEPEMKGKLLYPGVMEN